jgi:hypothetical protein
MPRKTMPKDRLGPFDPFPFDSFDEQGQVTTEYILLLAIVLSFFLLISKSVLLPKLQQVQAQLKARIETMYSGDNLHRLNFKVPK